jgi:PAS domain S-box-containing protein
MQNQDELYRAQIEQLKDYAVFFIDASGIVKTWNIGVEQLLGYAREEWIGKPASIIFTPADNAVALCEAEMAAATERGSASDIRWHRKKDQSELFANGVISAVYDSAGKLQGFTKLLSDETTRKKLEDSLVKANGALEHFAYTASHDLQEPLRTIGIYAQLLLEEAKHPQSAAGTQHLSSIVQSVARMEALISNLLSYARAGVSEEPAGYASLDADIESALSQLAGHIHDTGATVTHDPLPFSTVEHSQIVRLFLNLVSNAIKYRSPDQDPKIHVSASPGQHGEAVIAVADNGIGFAMEYAEKIFAPFTRLHGQQFAGSGVGLAICRRIVEGYGGRIWAESEEGRGSTFFFTVPESGR